MTKDYFYREVSGEFSSPHYSKTTQIKLRATVESELQKSGLNPTIVSILKNVLKFNAALLIIGYFTVSTQNFGPLKT